MCKARRIWFPLLLFLTLFARVGRAQSSEATRPPAGAIVFGAVHDSITARPLAAATVQLAGSGTLASVVRTVTSDSLGRYVITDVPPGTFVLGFMHPTLDSFGVSPPLRQVDVSGDERVRVDLAIPPPKRIREAICRANSAAGSGAVVVGVVRNAQDGGRIAGATVAAEWVEFTLTRQGFARRTPRVEAVTNETGWFALCDVPMPGAITLAASRGQVSTDVIEIQIPAYGLLGLELYLSQPASTAELDTRNAPVAATARGVMSGRLSGSVVAAVSGKPIVGARVRISDGPVALTNDKGDWELQSLPMGTRTIEVRAVGYYPLRQPVDVIVGATPLRASLSTFRAVLDTVVVTASRIAGAREGGFAERRRSGAGRYLTPQDIMRRNPIRTSDLFRSLPGISAEQGDSIKMRGAFGECSPGLYIDGRYVPPPPGGLTPDDIDDWVGNPDVIAGIEIYSEASVPPQFHQGLNGCGSIVIWTK